LDIIDYILNQDQIFRTLPMLNPWHKQS